MNEKKKPGCLWRLAKFGVVALILVVVAGFLFWWQRPDLRLMYYEYCKNPHKNGWREVMLATSPEYFRSEYDYDRFGDEEKAHWDKLWRAYYRRLDISPEEVGDLGPGFVDFELDRALTRQTFRLAELFAADHPELQDGEGDADPRLCSLAEMRGNLPFIYIVHNEPFFQQEYERLSHLRVPHLLIDEQEIIERQRELKYMAWRAEDYPELAAWVKRFQPLWDIASDAVREKKEFYPLPMKWIYGGGPNTLPDDMLLKRIATGLAVRSGMRLGEGDEAGAMKDLETLFIMGGKMRQTRYWYWSELAWKVENEGINSIFYNLGTGWYSRENLVFARYLLQECLAVRANDIESGYYSDFEPRIRIGIACQLYRMDKGEFPETLEMLIPEYLAAEDESLFYEKSGHYEDDDGTLVAYEGKRITYRIEKNSAVIYYPEHYPVLRLMK